MRRKQGQRNDSPALLWIFRPETFRPWTATTEGPGRRNEKKGLYMRDAGIDLAQAQFEANFLSTAHTAADIEQPVQVAAKV